MRQRHVAGVSVASAQAGIERIAPEPPGDWPVPRPAPDAAPEWVAQGTPPELAGALAEALGEEGLAGRASDLIRYASDASPYRSIPRAVAVPRDISEVASAMAVARRTGTPLVFRAGGTSLNGQSQTDGILLDCRRHFKALTIEEDGARVRVQPGAVLGRVNRRLARFGRRLGPDPASTEIACIGGVLANNSGGMRCGVDADSYSTVRSLTFALADGTVIDTAAPGAAERFASCAPALAAGLAVIRDELRQDIELAQRIARKFEIKNTTGYRLCAFLDADEPLEIFARLLIGSEGTLAFIGEAVMDTVPLGRHTTLSLTFFEDIDTAVDAVPQLVAAGASATELMVAPTLIAAAWNMAGTPEGWKELPPTAAALLVEFRAEDAAELDAREREAIELMSARSPLEPPRFSREHGEVEMLWRVREGMQGLLAAIRGPGISMIIEDVCVPPARVAEAAKDLQELLGRHGFLQGVAGHASAGNLHFLLTLNFGEQGDLDRYEAFMGELVDLIVERYDGSLKAEHGTGVNMAHYVEREWGPKATAMMWKVKRLADPDGVLGPGVVLSADEGAHLRNLKSTPRIEPEANQCIECGFCEPVCPSRDLTTTPRQRIVLRREMARQPEGSPVLEALLAEYGYDGIETCAADGLCSVQCPVGIDTGKLVKGLRARRHGAGADRAALAAARRWASVERGVRVALRAGRALGDGPTAALSGIARSAASQELIPAWSDSMPGAAPPPPWTAREGAAAVYFPACVNRIFGNPRGYAERPSLPEALLTLSARAGRPLWIPPETAGRCCGTPWSSKGFEAGHREMARATAAAVLDWTEGGELALVVDATSCTLGLLAEVPEQLDDALRDAYSRVRVLDSIAWVREELLDALEVRTQLGVIAVHPPCAATHLGLAGQLREVAAAMAERVLAPLAPSCCGTAGDRGLLHPELPAAAAGSERAERGAEPADAHVCSNRTCEIGLTAASGDEHGSFVLLLEELTRPGAGRAQ
jgi:D-lactate dehydrogenase